MYITKEEQIKEVKRRLRKAKKAYEKAQQYESDLFDVLHEYGINLDVPAPSAPNADNIGDMVTCYLQYNENEEHNVIEDIFAAQVNAL